MGRVAKWCKKVGRGIAKGAKAVVKTVARVGKKIVKPVVNTIADHGSKIGSVFEPKGTAIGTAAQGAANVVRKVIG